MRAYLKRSKGYTEYWACDRSIQKRLGLRVMLKILCSKILLPLRKDKDFLKYPVNDISKMIIQIQQKSHFLRLNFDMVTGFVIELMHTFEEGAFGNGLESFASISNEKQISKEALTEVKSKSCGFQVLERQLLASNIPSAIFHVDLSVNKPFISQTMLVYTNAGLKH